MIDLDLAVICEGIPLWKLFQNLLAALSADSKKTTQSGLFIRGRL